MDETTFEYSNLSGRPPGPFISTAGLFLPGVREVQAQVEPYAEAWGKHNRRAIAADGPLWVALGDSMTQGIGATAFDRGWTAVVADALPGHRLVNLSVSGGLVTDLLQRQVPALESLGVTPDLVTVMIGSNDLLNRRARTTLSRDLEQLIQRLPAGTVMATMPGGRRGADDLNRQVIGADHLVTAEFRDPRLSSWRGRVAQDHFHPNEAGYAAMGEVMRESIIDR